MNNEGRAHAHAFPETSTGASASPPSREWGVILGPGSPRKLNSYLCGPHRLPSLERQPLWLGPGTWPPRHHGVWLHHPLDSAVSVGPPQWRQLWTQKTALFSARQHSPKPVSFFSKYPWKLSWRMNLGGQVWGAQTGLGEMLVHWAVCACWGTESLQLSIGLCAHECVAGGDGVGGEDIMIRGWGRSQGISFNGCQWGCNCERRKWMRERKDSLTGMLS